MNERRLLILGGYGNSGIPIARHLLEETGVNLVLAGRSEDKARTAAGNLNADFNTSRVGSIRIDAADPDSLMSGFVGVDMVVVASSTVKYTRHIARAALDAGTDYLDLQYSSRKLEVLESMSSEIERSGRLFITEAGFHPGLPAALVRLAAERFDSIKTATISVVLSVDWSSLEFSSSTEEEFLGELLDFDSAYYSCGEWRKAGMFTSGAYRKLDFGERFGKRYAAAMMFEEMKALPGMYPSLQELGFYIAGINWFVDYIIFPIASITVPLLGSTAKKLLSALAAWGLKAFSKPPYGVVLMVEASGQKEGNDLTTGLSLYHDDAYEITAIPVAAALLQYLDGSIASSGLHMMGHIVEPRRLLRDMERMGVMIEEFPG